MKEIAIAWLKAFWANHYGTIIGVAVAFVAGRLL